MAFKMKNKDLGRSTKIAGESAARMKQSPMKFDYSGFLDKAGTALTGAGMIPIVGNFADAANTALSAGRAGYAKYKGDDAGAKRHAADAAINAAAMIPGAGLAVGGAKLAAKGAKAIKGADAVSDVAKLTKTQKAAGKTGEVVAKKGAKATAKKAVKDTVKEAPKNIAKEGVSNEAKRAANKPKENKKTIATKTNKPKKQKVA
tara:strand:- start:1206 stop:1814 length:609 start_codon:yes stop_codon:yes gene_type:complete